MRLTLDQPVRCVQRGLWVKIRACPGHLSRQVLAAVARTSRAMTVGGYYRNPKKLRTAITTTTSPTM
jgi:hypothetical protein